ncbi:hypothetical protein M440DRAFT_339462 [Trichoderma longibrachiatum ATCC 18648]|uniref:Uncharacterized protein n=1 Tax=Trichoderma longibrachiatum ATCC 18648 TaxID=983965 RepID=A0A2T4C101_TRILO|nr:hypothetical protein M440DRAFT_339462 [Trichoderma longibrachiatum ATCC 18648]
MDESLFTFLIVLLVFPSRQGSSVEHLRAGGSRVLPRHACCLVEVIDGKDITGKIPVLSPISRADTALLTGLKTDRHIDVAYPGQCQQVHRGLEREAAKVPTRASPLLCSPTRPLRVEVPLLLIEDEQTLY